MIRRVALALLVPVALVAWSGAATATAAPTAQNTGYLRLAHLSPDTPQVDVYVSSVADPARNFVAKGVGYGAVSSYSPVAPDTYTVSMRPAGAAESTPPVLSTTLTVREGAAYTVAGLGKYAELALRVLDDDLTMPQAGQARVRVIQASTKAPAFDVGVRGGASIATQVGFAQTTGYQTVPAGSWTLTATSGDGAPTELPVTLQATGVYTVVLIDKGDALAAVLHTDAIGAGPVIPTGGVETGLGATALSGPAAIAAGSLVGLAALGGALWVARTFRTGGRGSGPRHARAAA